MRWEAAGRRLVAGASRRPSLVVGGILLVALLLRLAVVVESRPYELFGDAHNYGLHAQWIAEELEYPPSIDGPDGGPTAFRPPLYPLFLAPFYALFGDDGAEVARFSQAFLGVVVAALVGLIASMLWGRRVGLIALTGASLFPPFMYTGAAILSETLFLAVMLAAVAATVQARRSPRRVRWAAAAGVFCGLAALTRSNGAILAVPLAVALVSTAGGGRRAALISVSALLAAAVLTVAPWTIRNAIAFDAFVPVSTQGGHTLAGAYNETVRRSGDLWQVPWHLPDFAHLYWRPRFRETALRAARAPGLAPRAWRTDVPEPELDRRLRAAATEHMSEHPGYVLEKVVGNAARLIQLGGPHSADFTIEELALQAPWSRRATTYLFYPFFALAIVGAFTAAARRTPRWLWLVPVVFLPALLVNGLARFRLPIDPFLIMLASLAVAALADRLGRPGLYRHRAQT
ncbi:MAG TPA: glycosyltransferase family 39 protein [Thermoleophilaceae bacterium]|nr:glycosyltransferase family 39 protein [Thermoleophilaceae bacterium]